MKERELINQLQKRIKCPEEHKRFQSFISSSSKLIHEFHGYKIRFDGIVLGKKGTPLSFNFRKRNGGKEDKRVCLVINHKNVQFTLSRLVAQCFHGPVYGLEVNHLTRDTMKCEAWNIEITTRSANQMHWREDEKQKREVA